MRYDIYRASRDPEEGAWSRKKLGTIEAADEVAANMQAVEKYGALPTYGDNTMLGSLRIFPAGTKVKRRGQMDDRMRRKCMEQYLREMSPAERDAYTNDGKY